MKAEAEDAPGALAAKDDTASKNTDGKKRKDDSKGIHCIDEGLSESGC